MTTPDHTPLPSSNTTDCGVGSSEARREIREFENGLEQGTLDGPTIVSSEDHLPIEMTSSSPGGHMSPRECHFPALG
jgi:hypothetical protein